MAAYYPLEDDDSMKKALETYIREKGLLESEEGHYDVRNKKIINLSNPTKHTDAVHKHYVDRRMKINDKKSDNLLTRDNDGLYVPSLIKNGMYNFGNQRITNVANPIINKDVATKEYVDSQNFYATIQEKHATYTTGGYKPINFNVVSSKLLEPNLKLTTNMYMKITVYLHSETYSWKPLIKIEIGNQRIMSVPVTVNAESVTCFAYGKRSEILKISISSDGDSNEIKPYLHVKKIEFL